MQVIDEVGAADLELRQRAAALVQLRKDRDAVLDSRLGSEPAWSLLLLLFASGKGASLGFATLARECCVAFSSCYRWSIALEDAGLVAIEPDPAKPIRLLVTLTDEGEAQVIQCLDLLTQPMSHPE